jgi:hypothetical protein
MGLLYLFTNQEVLNNGSNCNISSFLICTFMVNNLGLQVKQGRKFTYNMTLRSVCIIFVAVEKQ